MDYEIGNPEMVWLLLLLPAVLILIVLCDWKRRGALKTFGVEPSVGSTVRGVVSNGLLVFGLALLTVACMDIRWGKTTRTVPQKGLEVVFALDVSRSMLAQDARPNRLTRAKQQIKDMVGEMAGDRIGLVVFAGEAKQAVPLTSHYNDFRQKLDSVGPETVSKGGSQLGVAIDAAADSFLSKTNDHKTVVLLTDGEDQQSKPVELAQKLHDETGMRIFTVGLGDMDKGSRIPQDQKRSGKFVEHEGQQVWSRLNGSILQQIATATQGAYIPAGIKRVDMADVYHNYIANVEKSEFETAKINALIPRFQWFAFPALVCLVAYGWLSTARRQKREMPKLDAAIRAHPSLISPPQGHPESEPQRKSKSQSNVAANVAVILLALLPNVVSAQSNEPLADQTVAQQINAANDLVRAKKYGEAIDAFIAIDPQSQDQRDALNYNLAIAHFKNSDVEAARALFSEAAKSEDDRVAADSRYNLGNCHFANSINAAQQTSAAIAELKLAVVQYRSAIGIDRNHAHARENLERAIKLMKQLRDENTQQQKQQQQKQDNPEDAPKEQEQEQDKTEQAESSQGEKEQAKKENGSAEDSSGGTDEADASNSQNNGDESAPESSADRENAQANQSDPQHDSDNQAQPRQKSESQSADDARQEEQEMPAGSQNDSQPQSSPQQGSDVPRQKQNSNHANGTEESDTRESQPEGNDGEAPPLGEITAANQTQQQSGDENESSVGAISEQENGTMSRQEALKLLQSSRDRDMLRRLRKQQLQRSRRVRVERDW